MVTPDQDPRFRTTGEYRSPFVFSRIKAFYDAIADTGRPSRHILLPKDKTLISFVPQTHLDNNCNPEPAFQMLLHKQTVIDDLAIRAEETQLLGAQSGLIRIASTDWDLVPKGLKGKLPHELHHDHVYFMLSNETALKTLEMPPLEFMQQLEVYADWIQSMMRRGWYIPCPFPFKSTQNAASE